MSTEEPIPVTAYGFVSRMGRSSFRAQCPYCKTSGEFYQWSVAGHGARCKNPKCDGFMGLGHWRRQPRKPRRRKA